ARPFRCTRCAPARRSVTQAVRGRGVGRAAGGGAAARYDRRVRARARARRAPLPRSRRARGAARAGRRCSTRGHRMTGLFDRFGFLLPGIKDLLQILLVAAGLYYVLRALAQTRAMHVLAGILVLV